MFEADIILAEDTRNVYKIKSILKERFSAILNNLDREEEKPGQKVYSYRDQNHDSSLPEILKFIHEEKNIILVSDAGLPGISDPGYKLIRDLYKNNVEVDIIPTATAVDTALVLSGLPSDSFAFLGFLPREKGKIQKIIGEALQSKASSIIVYESPFRIVKSLELIAETLPAVNVAAVNDITKKFQRVERGNILEVIKNLKKKKIVGEWVLIFTLKQL